MFPRVKCIGCQCTMTIFVDLLQLVIPSTGFEHTGNFICFATYNGMTRYIEKRSICVRRKPQ